jgi:hypothetical protein
MHDLIAPFSRYVFLSGRTCVGHHSFDLATQYLLIELEGCLALAGEKKIGIQLHDYSPLIIND